MNRTDAELHRPAFTARSLTQISFEFLKRSSTRLDNDGKPGFVCFEMQQMDEEKARIRDFCWSISGILSCIEEIPLVIIYLKLCIWIRFELGVSQVVGLNMDILRFCVLAI